MYLFALLGFDCYLHLFLRFLIFYLLYFRLNYYSNWERLFLLNLPLLRIKYFSYFDSSYWLILLLFLLLRHHFVYFRVYLFHYMFLLYLLFFLFRRYLLLRPFYQKGQNRKRLGNSRYRFYNLFLNHDIKYP